MASQSESIPHLEDLDVKDFISVVRRISSMQASEKLDGQTMWFGVDELGKFFTSRPGKKASERMYSENDFPYYAANNAFRGAHAALEKKEADVRSVLSPGDTIEAEILYGRQPNSVAYGLDNKSFIAFVRAVNGTNPIKLQQIQSVLNNQEVSVRTIIVDSPDGENLDRKSISQSFRFVTPPKIDAEVMKSVKVERELKKLEAYLEKNSGVNNLSNYELMIVSLGSIPMDEREQAKRVKSEVVSTVKVKFKGAIKKELLDKLLSKVKTKLAASDLTDDEDVGIEGVTLHDQDTGMQVNLFDKDQFSTVNSFNYAVRNQISGMVRTLDDSAPIEARGGVTGVMKIRIAELLGNKNLAMGRTAKEIFADNRGENPTQTLKNVSKILHGDQDFESTKHKITALITATTEELKAMLAKFKAHSEDPNETYHLKLKSGKSIGMSPEIVKKTLMMFAETKRNLDELKARVSGAKSFDQMVGVLYGRAAKAVHDADGEDELTEESRHEIEPSLLLEARHYTELARFKEAKDLNTFFNCYLATLLMSVLIYKAKYKRGMTLLRDKTFGPLTKYGPNMSPVNFWGYGFWHSEKLKEHFATPQLAAELHRLTKKMPTNFAKFMHIELSYGNDLKINWAKNLAAMKTLLKYAPGASMWRAAGLLDSLFRYDELSYDEKVKLLPKLFFFGQQYVPGSPLIISTRNIQTELLAAGADTSDPDDVSPAVFTKGQTMKLLGEDGEIGGGGSANVGGASPGAGGGAGAASSSSTVMASSSANTTSQSISNLQNRIGSKRQIVKRKRNPNLKFVKFERPKEGEQE